MKQPEYKNKLTEIEIAIQNFKEDIKGRPTAHIEYVNFTKELINKVEELNKITYEV